MQVKVLLAGAMTLLLTACAHAQGGQRTADCGVDVDPAKLASVEALIVVRAQVREPTDMFPGGSGEACALLMFDLDENGRPENIRVKRVYPTRVYSDSAKRALSKYEFVHGKKKDLLIIL